MKKDMSTDAAYALGEEAFVAGFLAAVEANGGDTVKARGDAYKAYEDYEPSETVKDLLND